MLVHPMTLPPFPLFFPLSPFFFFFGVYHRVLSFVFCCWVHSCFFIRVLAMTTVHVLPSCFANVCLFPCPFTLFFLSCSFHVSAVYFHFPFFFPLFLGISGPPPGFSHCVLYHLLPPLFLPPELFLASFLTPAQKPPATFPTFAGASRFRL